MTQIGSFGPGTTLTGTEELVMRQGVTTRDLSLTDLAAYIGTGGGASDIDSVDNYTEVTEQALLLPWAVTTAGADETATVSDYVYANWNAGGGVMTTVDRGSALPASGLPGSFYKSVAWASTATPPIGGQSWPNPLVNSLYVQFGGPDAAVGPTAVGTHTHFAFDLELVQSVVQHKLMVTLMSAHGQWANRSLSPFTQQFIPYVAQPGLSYGWRTILIPLGALTQISAFYLQVVPEGQLVSSGSTSFRVDKPRLAARTKLDQALRISTAKTIVVPHDHVDTVRQYPIDPAQSKRLLDLRPDHVLVGREDGWRSLREWYLDETGTYDMAKELEQIFLTLPRGTKLRFPANARYQCNQGLQMFGLDGVHIDMNGAAIVCATNDHHHTFPGGGTLGHAMVDFNDCSGVTFDNWRAQGFMEVTQWAIGHLVNKGTATRTNMIRSTVSMNENPVAAASGKTLVPSGPGTGNNEWVAGTGAGAFAWFEAPVMGGFHTFSLRPTASDFTGTIEAITGPAEDVAISPNTEYNAVVYFHRDPQELNNAAGVHLTCWLELVWKDAAHAIISAVEDPQHAIRGPFLTQTLDRATKSKVVATSPPTAAFAALRVKVNVPVLTHNPFTLWTCASLLPGSSDANASRVTLSADADLEPQWNDHFQGKDVDGSLVFKFRVQNLNPNQSNRMAAYILWGDKSDREVQTPSYASTTITTTMTSNPTSLTVGLVDMTGWPTGSMGCYAVLEDELVKVTRNGPSSLLIERGETNVGYPTTTQEHAIGTHIYRLGYDFNTPLVMLNGIYNSPTDVEWKIGKRTRDHRFPQLHIRTFSLDEKSTLDTTSGNRQPVLYQTTTYRPSIYIGHLEGAHAFSITSRSHDIKFRNTICEQMGGDGIYISSLFGRTARDILIDGYYSRCCGRQGFAIETGSQITLQNFDISEPGRSGIDIEPNTVKGRVENLTMRNGRFHQVRNSAIATVGNADKIFDMVVDDMVGDACGWGSQAAFLLGGVRSRCTNIRSTNAPTAFNTVSLRPRELSLYGVDAYFENITATHGLTIGWPNMMINDSGYDTALLLQAATWTITTGTSVSIPDVVVGDTTQLGPDGLPAYPPSGLINVRPLVIPGGPGGAWISYTGKTATSFTGCLFLGPPPPLTLALPYTVNVLVGWSVYRARYSVRNVVKDVQIVTPATSHTDFLNLVTTPAASGVTNSNVIEGLRYPKLDNTGFTVYGATA